MIFIYKQLKRPVAFSVVQLGWKRRQGKRDAGLRFPISKFKNLKI